MRWFHSEHPLTVNLHSVTPQIHQHSTTCVQKQCIQYTVPKAVVIFSTTWWHCGIWSWTISNFLSVLFYFLFFFVFVVLMKGHTISGRCEGEKEGKGVKKTGKLRWGEVGWGNRGIGRFGMESSDISRDTKRKRMGRHQTFCHIVLTLISMPKPHCLFFYSTRDAETWVI